MPYVTLAMPNGHNPLSVMSFRKVNQDGSDHANGGLFSKDNVGEILRVNGVNGVGHKSSDVKNDPASVDVIRMRLKKGRAGVNRNGCLHEPRAGIPLHSNNGPLKAFPMINNGTAPELRTNTNNSIVPCPAADQSSLNSASDNSAPNTTRVSALPRPPLQRIHGRGPQKQRFPPGLADPLNQNGVGVEATLSEPVDQHINNTLPDVNADASPPLKSALHKNGSGSHLRSPVVQRETVTFENSDLPPGMQELHKEYFTPGAKGYFQYLTDIPVLTNTDAAILKRRSSISQAKKNRISTPTLASKSKNNRNTAKPDEGSAVVRSRSAASQIFIQPDMEILKACWNIILSFMGDDGSASIKAHRTIGGIISAKKKRLWRKSSTDLAMQKSSPLPSPLITGECGARPSSMFVLPSPAAVPPTKSTMKPHSSVPSGKKLPHSVSGLTVFDKVHFLANIGLKLPYLRDEIYCLILKQLVKNPSIHSTALGWILFALITGTFAPSEKVLIFVEKFIDHHHHAWSKYCGERLKRTVKNGPRTNPPCSLEIQAAKSAQSILFPVICMDNSAMTVTLDSATTSKEMLDSMAGKSRIGDSFGYCIVLQSYDQTVNLGSGRFPVLDSLSQVEMHAGRKFDKNICRLYYRRDIFSPRDLFCSSDDGMGVRLTFFQICGGVKTSEYFCKKAPDLTLIIAHQYCIQYGYEDADDRRISKFCEKCLPPDIYKSNKKSWSRTVAKTLSALRKKQNGIVKPSEIMAQVISYAMQNLTSHFVRKYSIMTFAKVGGVCTYTSDLSLSISHQGVTVRQGDAMKTSDHSTVEQPDVVTVPVVLMEITTGNLKKVKLETRGLKSGNTLTITDCVSRSYEITSAHGSEIYSVLFRYIRDIANGANKQSRA